MHFTSRGVAGLPGVLLVVLLAVVYFSPAHAFAFETCEERAQAWLDGCPEAEGHCLEPYACPPGLVLLHAGCLEETSVDIELGPASASAFRTVGPIGVSPIGEFPEWSREPRTRRAAFDAVLACARRDPTLLEPGPGPAPHAEGDSIQAPSPRLSGSGVPWRLVWGLVALAGLVVVRRREGPERESTRSGRLEPVGLLVLAAATLIVRVVVFGTGFFHENGQGPLWIATALDPVGDRSHYGPGYWELYSALATATPSPEAAVFWMHSVLGAVSSVLVWLLARTLGARPAVAWALALIVATNPVLGWIFGSESYYAAWFVAILLAALALALGFPERIRVVPAMLALLAAGLVVSQAARVVPVGWLPAATLPLVVVVGQGRPTGRVVTAIAVGVGIALIVAASTGATMLSVLDGYLGDAWLDEARTANSWASLGLFLALPAAALTLAIALRNSRSPGSRIIFAALAMAALVLVIERSGSILEGYTPATRLAYWSLGLPVGVAIVVALLRDVAPKHRVRAHVVVLIFGIGGNVLAAAKARPMTDGLELRWFLDNRERIPPDAMVFYMGQAEKLVLHLPVYPRTQGARRSEMVMGLGSGEPYLPTDGRPLIWVRTSLCATPELADVCREFEAELLLEPLATTALPARCWDCEYVEDPVSLGIYRIVPPARE